MKFVCDRCQTKYSIADEKVRGKILKVRCKSCANIITVREEPGARRASAPAVPVGGVPAPTGSAPRSTIVSPPLADPVPAARAPAARPPVAAPAAPPAPPVERRATPRPPAPAPDDGVSWYMALSGNRTGPFSRKQLIDQIAPLPKDADVHVWSERLGAWKPPMDVPVLANDLHARRRPQVPIPPMPPLPAAPAVPPPFPGAPRRPTAPSAPLAAAPAPASIPPRPSGAHPVVPPPTGSGLGAKLPPPASSGRRSPTGPIPRPAGLAAAPAAPSVASDEPEIDLSYGEPPQPGRGADLHHRSSTSHPAMDSASLLETPGPTAAVHHALGTNGLGHAPEPNGTHALSNGASSTADRSDGLNVLNLAPEAVGDASANTPRLMSSESVVGWQPSAGDAAANRHKTTRIVVAFMAVIGAAVVLLTFTMMKKPKPVVPPPVASKAQTTDPLAAVIENPQVAAPSAPGTAPAPEPARAPEPAAGGRSHGHGHVARGRSAPASGGSTSPPPVAFAQGNAAPPAPADDANAKYRDTRNLNITAQTSSPRPPPSQSDISRVINNNRNGIKNCYQRALLRDNSLTHGKITVKVNIGISGRVKHVAVDGPPQFRTIDPCIREVVGRWAFPPAGEEYGTEFVYVFQGNE
jgi:predicted Zn finger-like uncharacterized protein